MAGIADAIAALNEAGANAPTPDDKGIPAPSSQQTAPTDTPPAPPLGKEPAPPTPPAPEPKATPAQPAPNNTAPAAEPMAGNAPPTPPEEEAVPDNVFYGRLSKLTDNAIKSEQDFVGFINHYNELLAKEQQGFEPKFKDERTKMVYQKMAELSGSEAAQAAMRDLRALSFNPDGKSVQEKLFEAYLLDPKNSDLDPVSAQKYFQAEYDKMYSDVEDNPLTQRQQALAVREAEQRIKQVQESFKAAEEQPRVISEQVERSIQQAVDNFGGVRMAFTDNPQESDFLNMPIDDPQELDALKQDALNPQGWWNNFMQNFMGEKGFDYQSFSREFYEMRNHQKKAQLAYDHGFKLGELAAINKARNASDPKRLDQANPAVQPQKGAPKSIGEAWFAAKG